MYNLLTLALAGVLAALPLASAGVATKSCPCYTATETATPSICPMCMPANCFVYPTITTTIPGPNPTCKETPTHVVSKPCPCGGDWCPTAWVTKTGAFTCKRGGTKETDIAGTGALPQTTTSDGVMSILPIDMGTPVLSPAPTPSGDGEGMMSILPIETETAVI